ncbi:MAG TPA: HAMP domain-containing sensor histidine kinase, partial [Patescibacteria group bacterium]|nr:HAMP domain-containing sensor histidine kinase [Patescibacteria group bacterium]
EPVTVYDNYVAKGDKTGKIERIEERKVYFTYPLIQGDTPKAILSVTYLLKETDSLIDELDHGRSVRNFLFAFLVLVIVTILGALLDDRVKLSRQLLTSIESKDDLLAMASHELGSPLTNIKGSLAIILKEKGEVLEPRVRSLIERAASSAEDLINLVEDLLVVFRFERNKMEIYPRPGHIDAIVEQVVQNFQTAAHQKGITLTFDHPIGMLPRTVFDPEKIREVLNNLVSNAVKYTEKGSVTVNIEKRDDTEEVIVSVKDTGYGIKMSDVDKLFQRFVRLKRTEKVVKGTGLGLYIAKLIMEAHHGRIWAESTEGRGSVFSFSLPLR